MSKFIVEPLKAIDLEQPFNLNHRKNIRAVRLNLFKYLSPVGTFTVNLIKDSTTIVTKSLTSAEIESSSDGQITNTNYFHGIITFEFADNVRLSADTDYKIVLTSSGYTFSEAAYMGWKKDFESYIYPLEYIPIKLEKFPYSFELWGYERSVRV